MRNEELRWRNEVSHLNNLAFSILNLAFIIVRAANTNHGNATADSVVSTESIPDETETIVEYVRKNHSVTRKEIEAELRVGSTKAYKLVKSLCDQGVLQTQGQGNQTAYTLAK